METDKVYEYQMLIRIPTLLFVDCVSERNLSQKDDRRHLANLLSTALNQLLKSSTSTGDYSQSLK